jgi:SWI/SNF-related matrix-associated actin-dependent regulator 1 of chromatin subfamily A
MASSLLNAKIYGNTGRKEPLIKRDITVAPAELFTGEERDNKILKPSKKDPRKRRWFSKEELKTEKPQKDNTQINLFEVKREEFSAADVFKRNEGEKHTENLFKVERNIESAEKDKAEKEPKTADEAKETKEKNGPGRLFTEEELREASKKYERNNLTYNERKKRFEFKGYAGIKDVPKGAGFIWDKQAMVWHTQDVKNAEKIKDYASGQTKELIGRKSEERNKTLADSRRATSDKEFPSPAGLVYADYQKAAIEFSLERKNVLIADQMGLGKTIEAIGVINADEKIKKVLIVTPASLKYNWKKELKGDARKKGWLVRDMSAAIINSTDYEEADIQIINYDILNKHLEKLSANKYDLTILDEAHYIKNQKAQRTIAALQLLKESAKRILMTGTPIMNRPMELFSLLKGLENPLANNWMYYAKRYCAAWHGRFGWNVKGASHLDELQDKLRSTVMIRRLKSDVLKELPPKRRQIIELPADKDLKPFINQEKEVVNKTKEETTQLINKIQYMRENSVKDEEYNQAVDKLKEAKNYEFTELEKIRHEMSVVKAQKVIGDLEDLLETEEKFVIFAHHKDVINIIYQHFKDKAVKLTGESNAEERNKAVEKFQNDDSIKLFVGNIQAAGVGLTLTASSTVIFLELAWDPSTITQAEDRLHRRGQEKNVTVIHYVVDGSIDSMMAKYVVEKQDIIDKALDKEAETKAAKKEIELLDEIL